MKREPSSRAQIQLFAGLGVTATDLFVSSSAALMLALALASKERPTANPVQADLVAFCIEHRGETRLFLAPASVVSASGDAFRIDDPSTVASVSNLEEGALAAAVPGLLAVVALVAVTEQPTIADCFPVASSWIASHNDGAGQGIVVGGPILSLVISNGVIEDVSR